MTASNSNLDFGLVPPPTVLILQSIAILDNNLRPRQYGHFGGPLYANCFVILVPFVSANLSFYLHNQELMILLLIFRLHLIPTHYHSGNNHSNDIYKSTFPNTP